MTEEKDSVQMLHNDTTRDKSSRGKNAQDEALMLAAHALASIDNALAAFMSNNSLPEPIACKPGCHYCCFNQPMLTPPEALLIGHYAENTFTDPVKQDLFANMERILDRTRGKSPEQVVRMRHELPCIFLKDGICLVYK
ncbi:MAG: hypothetical protein ACLFVT_06960, partial [Syntrophobacteria bacterium]